MGFRRQAVPSPQETSRRLKEFSPENPSLVANTLMGFIGDIGSAAAPLEKAAMTGLREEASTVYRVWGGAARPWGRSWTDVNPLTVKNYRNLAGLPQTNTAQYMTIGKLRRGPVSTHPAYSLDGNVGGLHEVEIPDSRSQVIVTEVLRLPNG